jgi:hypothetical protein
MILTPQKTRIADLILFRVSGIPTHKHPPWNARINDYGKKVCEKKGDTVFAPYPRLSLC